MSFRQHDLMHKLTGSSGGYGFDELYQLSHQAMILTSNNQVSNSTDMQQCLQSIYAILQQHYDFFVLNE